MWEGDLAKGGGTAGDCLLPTARTVSSFMHHECKLVASFVPLSITERSCTVGRFQTRVEILRMQEMLLLVTSITLSLQ